MADSTSIARRCTLPSQTFDLVDRKAVLGVTFDGVRLQELSDVGVESPWLTYRLKAEITVHGGLDFVNVVDHVFPAENSSFKLDDLGSKTSVSLSVVMLKFAPVSLHLVPGSLPFARPALKIEHTRPAQTISTCRVIAPTRRFRLGQSRCRRPASRICGRASGCHPHDPHGMARAALPLPGRPVHKALGPYVTTDLAIRRTTLDASRPFLLQAGVRPLSESRHWRGSGGSRSSPS